MIDYAVYEYILGFIVGWVMCRLYHYIVRKIEKRRGEQMKIVINLTKNEIKRLSELTDIEMDADDEDGLLDDDVSDAVSILIEKSITNGKCIKCITCYSKDCSWNENDKCQCDDIELGNYAECLMWSEEDNE